jgi:hypothetical protein
MKYLVLCTSILTSLREKPRINALKGVLPNYTGGAFRLEAAVDSF